MVENMCNSEHKKVIFQIGRVDKGYNESKTFSFEGNTYNFPLSSFALKQLSSKEAKVVILYPVSLVLNESFSKYEGEDDFLKKQVKTILNNESEKEKYLNNPYSLFKNHPHSKENDFEVLHSLGTYSGKTFSTTMHDLVLYIWCLMMREYLKTNFEEIYIDISSGLNFHMASLQEALRYFLMWECLYNISESKVKGIICYTDPILGSAQSFYNIYTYETKHKALFKSSMYSNEYSNISKYIIEEFLNKGRDDKRKVNNLLEKFFIIFSSFENAVPLALFTRKLYENDNNNQDENIFNNIYKKSKEELKNLSEFTIEKFKTNWIQSPEADFDKFSKLFFTLGFLHGLLKFLNENEIKPQEYVSIECLEYLAGQMEKQLGLKLQSGLIKNEIYNNFRHGDFDKKLSENKATAHEWINLSDLLKFDNTQKDINERNFFAHAGFEKNITLVKKYNGKLVVKYKDDDETIKEIKGFLLNRVKGE